MLIWLPIGTICNVINHRIKIGLKWPNTHTDTHMKKKTIEQIFSSWVPTSVNMPSFIFLLLNQFLMAWMLSVLPCFEAISNTSNTLVYQDAINTSECEKTCHKNEIYRFYRLFNLTTWSFGIYWAPLNVSPEKYRKECYLLLFNIFFLLLFLCHFRHILYGKVSRLRSSIGFTLFHGIDISCDTTRKHEKKNFEQN